MKSIGIYINGRLHCIVGEQEQEQTLKLLRAINPSQMVEAQPIKENEWDELQREVKP